MIRLKLVEYRGNRTQEEMGKMYGVTQQAWSYWERGEKTPEPRIMKAIEIDSGVQMEDLFPDAFDNVRLSENPTDAA